MPTAHLDVYAQRAQHVAPALQQESGTRARSVRQAGGQARVHAVGVVRLEERKHCERGEGCVVDVGGVGWDEGGHLKRGGRFLGWRGGRCLPGLLSRRQADPRAGEARAIRPWARAGGTQDESGPRLTRGQTGTAASRRGWRLPGRTAATAAPAARSSPADQAAIAAWRRAERLPRALRPRSHGARDCCGPAVHRCTLRGTAPLPTVASPRRLLYRGAALHPPARQRPARPLTRRCTGPCGPLSSRCACRRSSATRTDALRKENWRSGWGAREESASCCCAGARQSATSCTEGRRGEAVAGRGGMPGKRGRRRSLAYSVRTPVPGFGRV